MDDARQFIRNASSPSDRTFVSPYGKAMAEAAIADNNAAIEALERSADAREGQILYVRLEPAFDKLRADSRYRALEQRVGLDQHPSVTNSAVREPLPWGRWRMRWWWRSQRVVKRITTRGLSHAGSDSE